MRQPLILSYYSLLPSDADAADSLPFAAPGIDAFQRAVEARYFPGTLAKLLESHSAEIRQAATLALGRVGTMQMNRAVARRLHDEDPIVRGFAAEALWAIWFRADSPENNAELRRLSTLERDTGDDPLPGLDALAERCPRFAEVFNQRAIVYFRRGEFALSVADCDRVLRINPVHFGAASGMGQCFMKLRRFRAALRSFRRARRINPNLEGVREAISSLERMLGEEGKR